MGIPDERWGQAVTAVITLNDGAALDAEMLKLHVRDLLAAYKTPKHILTDGPPLRAPNGKADYKSATEFAEAQIVAAAS